MKKLLTLLLCFLLVGCGNDKITFTQMKMMDAINEMKTSEGYVIVDVRSWDEYNSGHIPNAICIPNESIKEEVVELADKDQVIYVYCRSGNRSKQAAEKLANLGYTHIIEIGGIIDYTEELE